jgi:hypothetical protein
MEPDRKTRRDSIPAVSASQVGSLSHLDPAILVRPQGEQKTNMLSSSAVAVRPCTVSFKDARGIRHGVEVEAESLYEAAILGIQRLNRDPWLEKVGPGTVLDVEVREPGTRHSISLQQIERWLAGTTSNPNEAMKRAKLKMMLVKG